MVPEVESVHEDLKERKMVLEGKPESKIQGREPETLGAILSFSNYLFALVNLKILF